MHINRDQFAFVTQRQDGVPVLGWKTNNQQYRALEPKNEEKKALVCKDRRAISQKGANFRIVCIYSFITHSYPRVN